MNADIRRKLAMAARVLDFARAHPFDDASYNKLVARLEDRVKRGDDLALQQFDGTEQERAAIGRRLDLRQDMLRLQVRHLITAAALALPEHPELAGKFVMPSRATRSHKAYITAAKSLLEAAQANRDLFLSLGVGDTFLDEFSKSVDEFDSSTHLAHSRKSDHVGAAAEMNAVGKELLKLVGMLNGTYRTRFRNDAEALAAWDSARIIVAIPSTKAPEPDPAPAPAPTVPPVAGEITTAPATNADKAA